MKKQKRTWKRLAAMWEHLQRRERRAWSKACRCSTEAEQRPWLDRFDRNVSLLKLVDSARLRPVSIS